MEKFLGLRADIEVPKHEGDLEAVRGAKDAREVDDTIRSALFIPIPAVGKNRRTVPGEQGRQIIDSVGFPKGRAIARETVVRLRVAQRDGRACDRTHQPWVERHEDLVLVAIGADDHRDIGMRGRVGERVAKRAGSMHHAVGENRHE